MSFAPSWFFAAVILLAAEPQTSWHDVTLGAPASTLRASLGDPLRIVSISDRRVARYWLVGSNSTYLLVVEQNGYVADFEAFTDAAPSGILDNVAPDPSGVRLGDTMGSVKSKHLGFHQDVDEDGRTFIVGRISSTVGASYTFQNGRLRSFFWRATPSDSNPALARLTAPAGDSVSSAILDVQRNDSDGVAWEYRYLTFHPCADNSRWQLKNQSLLHDGAHAYDRLHVVCPATNAERDFYFDISSYFGKT
jgi:hypothetical protein